MVMKVFFHGVPDSPAIWSPLLSELGLDPATISVPGLPGFQAPAPPGFGGTKDDYVGWAIKHIRELAATHGPVDIIGHDWGALIGQRTALLAPDAVRSWAISNAVIDPDYRGHRVARIWNTPVLGEFFMATTRASQIEASLSQSGVPAKIAAEEAVHWKKRHMRQAILGLYRSAKGLSFAHDWALDLDRASRPGLLVWGENDPFVDVSVARRFSQNYNVPLQVISNAGHWAIAEKPDEVAGHLIRFWAGLDRNES